MRRLILLTSIFFFCSTGGFSQKLNIGNTEYVSSATLFREKGNFSMIGGYRRVNFINPVFAHASQSGALKNSGGVELSIAYMTIYPLELELTGFYSFFKAPSLVYESVGHRGFEFMLNYFVLPYVKGISKWFCPYIGAGYQTSQVALNSDIMDDESDERAYVGTGGLLFKGGVRIYYSRNSFFIGEYRQTFTNTTKLFSVWSIGFGGTF
jgi:hypothetical protein